MRAFSVRWTSAVVAAIGLVYGVGCTPTKSVEPSPSPEYEVRGVVLRTAEQSLLVRHEAIHDFVNREGDRVGMDSMSMPFSVAPNLPIETLEEGDKIRFRFRIAWEDRHPPQIVAWEELPPETELVYSAAER